MAARRYTREEQEERQRLETQDQTHNTKNLGPDTGHLRPDTGSHPTLEEPDHPAHHHQPNRDQLRSTHQSSEHKPAPRVSAQKLEKEPRYAIQNQIRSKHLAIEFFPLQHPHQQKEIRQLHRRLKQLRWLERLVQRRAHQIMRYGIRERHAPPRMRRLAETAPGRETPHAPNRVTQRQA